MPAWTAADIPDQTGRVAIVTGSNTGLGLETARELTRAGATVVVAVRNPDKGKAAIDEITGSVGDADVRLQQLDLSSLDAVRESAAELREQFDRIDLLVNNAGVMYPPFELTTDGYELQFATNHLGHFALTGLLLDRMAGVEGSRIVTTSSVGHRAFPAEISREAVSTQEGFNTIRAYGRSKLANLLFTYALQRRLRGADAATEALAAHPGLSATELGRHAPRLLQPVAKVVTPLVSQPAARGALPQLRAATDPAATGGQYYGPSGFGETRGDPVLVDSSDTSHDEALQERLWAMSEEMTGVSFPS